MNCWHLFLSRDRSVWQEGSSRVRMSGSVGESKEDLLGQVLKLLKLQPHGWPFSSFFLQIFMKCLPSTKSLRQSGPYTILALSSFCKSLFVFPQVSDTGFLFTSSSLRPSVSSSTLPHRRSLILQIRSYPVSAVFTSYVIRVSLSQSFPHLPPFFLNRTSQLLCTASNSALVFSHHPLPPLAHSAFNV